MQKVRSLKMVNALIVGKERWLRSVLDPAFFVRGELKKVTNFNFVSFINPLRFVIDKVHRA